MSDKMSDNWWDGLTDEQIAELQHNQKPLGLCWEWMEKTFCDMDRVDREFWNYIPTSPIWEKDPDTLCQCEIVYRLRSDWTRPAPEKVGRWEYCDVSADNDTPATWVYDRADRVFALREAFDSVGYGGIEFAEWPDRWFMHIPGMVEVDGKNLPSGTEVTAKDHKPATPRRVRFWREG